MIPPFNFMKWIQENKEKLQPPVNNYCLWREKDFTIMAVGGPNKRTDYHVNPTEEYFYQLKGSMTLKIVENNIFRDVTINEGEMFLLPSKIPHNPIRYENTVGLVIEVKRPEGQLDALRWYCSKCSHIVYEETFYCVYLGVQLKPIILKVANDEALRTCNNCHFINPTK